MESRLKISGESQGVEISINIICEGLFFRETVKVKNEEELDSLKERYNKVYSNNLKNCVTFSNIEGSYFDQIC